MSNLWRQFPVLKVFNMRPVISVLITASLLFFFSLYFPFFLYSQEEINLKEQAIELFMDNKPMEALPLMENALQQNPSDAELYIYLATCYEQLGNFEAAIQTYEKGLNLNLDSKAVFYYNRGNNYQRLGKLDNALESYSKAVREDSSLADAYLNRANVLVRKIDYSRAVADYRLYLSLRPKAPQRENIEQMISLLSEKVVAAEKARVEEERRRREEEKRRQELLEQVLSSLEESGEETKNISAGTGEVKEYDQEFDIID